MNIAIIGLSFRLPGASDLDTLDKLLSEKINMVKKPSPERAALFGITEPEKCFQRGYLEDIDKFDPEYFGMGKIEANRTDPQQRMLLEMTTELLEYAGYSTKAFRGSNTAVILGAEDKGYNDLLANLPENAMLTNISSVIPAKISYFYDLHGVSMAVNSSCSSALYAVKYACDLLEHGETDCAICGGIQLNLSLYKDLEYQNKSISIASKSSVCRPFDDESDGSVAGEAAVLFLLKKLSDAERDNDHIYAVIRGFAANHNGFRSNSLASPSSDGQTEVIVKAIQNAGVNPENIGLIETHGTGTNIGDPIEIKGLSDAFHQFTEKRAFCSLGAVKSNFGHAGICAGAVGLLKAVASLSLKKRYPIANYHQPNRLIDFENSPFYPQSTLDHWEQSGIRTAGVSSLGLSGTNVFGILTEYPQQKPEAETASTDVFSISAASEDALQRYKAVLASKIAQSSDSVKALCAAMNYGRNDDRFRDSAVVHNREEILQFLQEQHPVPETKPHRVILAYSGDALVSAEKIRAFCRDEVFRKHYDAISHAANGLKEEHLGMVFYLAAARALAELGMEAAANTGSGMGNAVVKVQSGAVRVTELKAEMETLGSKSFDAEKFKQVMTELCRKEHYLFADVLHGEMAIAFEETATEDSVSVDLTGTESIYEVFHILYNAGATVNWKQYYHGSVPRRAVLPSYPFAENHVWPEHIRTAQEATEQYAPVANAINVKQYLHDLWSGELGTDGFCDDDSFFDMGADSLKAMNVADQIQEDLGVSIEFEDFYDYETVNDLADYLESKMREIHKNTNPAADAVTDVPVEENQHYPVSYNQSRMIGIFLENRNSVGYNIFYKLSFESDIDIHLLEQAICETVAANEMLRTIYGTENGTFYQCVQNAEQFHIVHLPDTMDLQQAYEQEAGTVIDIFQDLPIRIAVLQQKESCTVFITVHHIAADGTAMQIIMKEISERYHAIINGKAYTGVSSVSYVSYAAYEQKFLDSSAAQAELDYWLHQLDGIPYKVDMPYYQERPKTVTYVGETLQFDMSDEMLAALKKLSTRYSMTPFMLLESIFVLELYLYSGTEDICIGVPVQGRRLKGTEHTVGFFANSVVMRSKFCESLSVQEFLKGNQEMILAAFKNQDYPFEKVVSKLKFTRHPAYHPVFQYFFQCQPYDFSEEKKLGNSVFKLDQGKNESSKFEISMCAFYDQSFRKGRSIIEYNTDLFERMQIEEFVSSLDSLVQQIAADDTQDIHALQLNCNFKTVDEEEDFWN